MQPRVSLFLAGLLFGFGLCISGMIDPAKVKGFLDVTRDWDPSLIFVMAGAILVHGVCYQLWLKRKVKPNFAPQFSQPEKRGIDSALLVGAALFGIGWGLSGYCPGPALVSLVTLNGEVWMFVGAMLVGMILARTLRSYRTNA